MTDELTFAFVVFNLAFFIATFIVIYYGSASEVNMRVGDVAAGATVEQSIRTTRGKLFVNGYPVIGVSPSEPHNIQQLNNMLTIDGVRKRLANKEWIDE